MIDNQIQDLSVKLTAANSSGVQELHFTHHNYQGGFVTATLEGQYNDEKLQIDFDEMSLHEVDEMILSLQLIRDEYAKSAALSRGAS